MTLRERLDLTRDQAIEREVAPAREPEAPAEREPFVPEWLRRARDPKISPNGLARDLTAEPVL